MLFVQWQPYWWYMRCCCCRLLSYTLDADEMKITRKYRIFTLLCGHWWYCFGIFVFVYIFLRIESDVCSEIQCQSIWKRLTIWLAIVMTWILQFHVYFFGLSFDYNIFPLKSKKKKIGYLALNIDNGTVAVGMSRYVYYICRLSYKSSQTYEREARSHAYTNFRQSVKHFKLLPGNYTIESEIRWTFFNCILADTSKIYYERSLFGIVLSDLVVLLPTHVTPWNIGKFIEFSFECKIFKLHLSRQTSYFPDDLTFIIKYKKKICCSFFHTFSFVSGV